MSLPTAVLLCPGRGSYTKDELGFVKRTLRAGPVAEALAACDDWRRSQGRPTLTEIDGAEKFRPGLHLEGENAAELIFFGTMAHAEQLRERYDIVAVAGNSLGWYTALPVSGRASIRPSRRPRRAVSWRPARAGPARRPVAP